jgi:hypothetical protein
MAYGPQTQENIMFKNILTLTLVAAALAPIGYQAITNNKTPAELRQDGCNHLNAQAAYWVRGIPKGQEKYVELWTAYGTKMGCW